MGKRKRGRQPSMWVTTTDLPTAASHPFTGAGISCCPSRDSMISPKPSAPPFMQQRWVGPACDPASDSELGIAWRAADSLALRDFVGVGLEDAPPDHSTISRTRPTRPNTPSIAGNGSSGNAVNRSSDRVRICARPVVCDARTSAGTRTCSSACSCVPAPSISGSGCGRCSASAHHAASRALPCVEFAP
jgi:Transposase domain (DUF772)